MEATPDVADLLAQMRAQTLKAEEAAEENRLQQLQAEADKRKAEEDKLEQQRKAEEDAKAQQRKEEENRLQQLQAEADKRKAEEDAKAQQRKEEENRLQQLQAEEDKRKAEEHAKAQQLKEEENRLQQLQAQEADAKAAEETRKAQEADAKAAEETRKAQEADAKAAEERRLREASDKKNAHQQRPLKTLPRLRMLVSPKTNAPCQVSKEIRRWDIAYSELVAFDLEALGIKRDVESSLMRDVEGDCVYYSSESEVVTLVKRTLKDICSMLGFKVQVVAASYLSQHNNEGGEKPGENALSGTPDLTVMRAFGVILAVVEVKKPGKNVFVEDQDTFDQVYKYLQLAEGNGVLLPMAILSTYEGWCFFWLDSAHGLATAGSIDDVNNAIAKSINDVNSTIANNIVNTIRRTMHYSQMFSYDDIQLIDHLLCFIYKCSRIPQVPQTGMLWLQFFPENFRRMCLKMNDVDKELIETPPVTMPKDVIGKNGSLQYDIYLVKTLGSGSDGHAVLVYMVTKDYAKSVKWCVVKFFADSKEKLEDRESKAKKEAKALSDAYPESKPVYLVLCRTPAVLMPYRIVLSDSEFNDAKTQDLILKHVKKLAIKGIMHNDLDRRHVAWTDYKKDKENREDEENKDRKICFIDWAGVDASEYVLASTNDNEFIEDALKNAKKSLKF